MESNIKCIKLGNSLTKGNLVADAVMEGLVMDGVPTQEGVYVQQNGSMIPLRGGIYRPAKGSFIRNVYEIAALPWTKDGIIDAYMFRMCDEFVKMPTTDWETKRQAIHSMIYHSFGFTGGLSDIDDNMITTILNNNPYDEDDNGKIVKMWQLGIIDPDMPAPMDTE